MADEAPSLIPVADLFARIGAELRDLARQLVGVEAALSDLSAASSRLPRDAVHVPVTELQALDIVLQSLVSLSQFSERLSMTMASSEVIDVAEAARAITLSDLAARLARRPAAGGPSAPAGDIEYF